jgi:hypothetical protein
MVIVASLTSLEHGAVPVTVYWNVLEVAPAAGVKVPAPELKVPPLPVNLDQVPPASSPVINENRSTAEPLVSHTDVEPSIPAFGATCSVTATLAVASVQPADVTV